MKQVLFYTAIALSVSTLCSCYGVAPVTNQYEKAGTLGKGNLELMGAFTTHTVTVDGESNSTNDNYGFRAGYGISDHVDVKLRYERLVPTYREDGDPTGIDYISVVPKVAIVPRKFAVLLPISRYTYTDEFEGQKERYNINSIAPQLLYTATTPKNKFDFTLGAKGDYTFSSDNGEHESDFFVGATMGAGFSSNLDKWAIRPEVGILFKPGESGNYWSYGVAAQFVLPTAKKPTAK